MNSAGSYKNMLGKLVCSTDNKECMLGRCEKCPNKQELYNGLSF